MQSQSYVHHENLNMSDIYRYTIKPKAWGGGLTLDHFFLEETLSVSGKGAVKFAYYSTMF